MAATPDVCNDILDLLRTIATVGTPATIVVRPPDVGQQNAFAGSPKPSKDSGIEDEAVFAEYVGEITDHDNDNNNRRFLVDLIVRGGRNAEEAARVRAVTVRDAINEHERGTYGRWTAPISGKAYIDLEVTGMESSGPLPDDTCWWVLHVEAWFNG